MGFEEQLLVELTASAVADGHPLRTYWGQEVYERDSVVSIVNYMPRNWHWTAA